MVGDWRDGVLEVISAPPKPRQELGLALRRGEVGGVSWQWRLVTRSVGRRKKSYSTYT